MYDIQIVYQDYLFTFKSYQVGKLLKISLLINDGGENEA